MRDPDATLLNNRAIMARLAPFTMTSPERQLALLDATRYVVRRRIPGCVVECGVWRGGSAMDRLYALIDEGAVDREVYLYDTYSGMTIPTDADMTFGGTPARAHLERDVHRTGYWCEAKLVEVRGNILSTGYPDERVHYIEGPVEKTLPEFAPREQFALLRLDTDWYVSTKCELEHLFPLISHGSVLIIDDYGHWQDAICAVDEYFLRDPVCYLMQRIDYPGRLLIKM